MNHRLLPLMIGFLAWALLLGSQTSYSAPLPGLSDVDDDDRPEKLVPKDSRSATEADHVAAAALFAHARVLMQRDDLAGALRRMQRAWRLDGESLPILAEIVPLAFKLKHSDEGARYAVLLAERDPKDAGVMIRLAAYLSDQKEMNRCTELYERAIGLQEKLPQDAEIQLLHLEVGRHYLTLTSKDAKEKAAAAFTRVRDAYDDPDQKKVATELRRLLGGKPETMWMVLGDGFFQAGKYDDAAAIYRRVNELKKSDDMLAFRLARIDAERGNLKPALEKLQRYFEANMSEAGTNAIDVLEMVLKKQYLDEAAARAELISRLEKLHQRFDTNVPVTFSLAEHYRKAKRFDKAEPLYLELLKNQAAIDLYQGLVSIYVDLNQNEKLLAMLGQATLKVNSLDDLGEVAKRISGDKERFEKLVQLARQQLGTKPPTLADGAAWAISQLAIDAKRFDVAEEFFEVAIKSPQAQKPQIMVGFGLQVFAAEQLELAAKTFRRAIDEKVLPENNQSFYFYLSGALTLANKHDEALEAAKKSLAAGQKTAKMLSRLAWIPYHAKRYAEAEKAYQDLLKEYDEDHSSTEVRETMREARLALSNLCVLQKRVPQGEEWLEQVLDEFPEDVGAANDLGYLWADQNKNLSRALALVQRAVAAEPKNKSYRDSLGWALHRLGRNDEALRELTIAAEVEDVDGVIWDHLGDVQARLNLQPAAIASWKKAAESFKKEKDDDKLRQTENKIRKLGG